MNKTIATLLVLLTIAPLFAQKPLDERQSETLQLEQYQRNRDSSSPAIDEQRRQAEWLQSDIVRKANKFALLWAQFTAEVNARHTFNVKLARKLEKAFNDLEKAQGWPAE
jgi:septal ring factor EnvC (AmiA/AmiB activator)